jgi:hypothetical protein
MPEYILLMHNDALDGDAEWEPYLTRLKQDGFFEGGSAIGDGICVRQRGTPAPLTIQLAGYIRLSAENLEQAKSLLAGNPHFEAGGTVEIRELSRTD